MTTIRRAMPLALQLADIGARYFPAAGRRAATNLRNSVRGRPVHELSDWILNDIGLERQDAMSPEARRAMQRLNGVSYW